MGEKPEIIRPSRIVSQAVTLGVMGVLSWQLVTLQRHAEKIAAYDQHLMSLDAKVSKIDSSFDRLCDRVDRGFDDIRNQINKNK